MNLKGVINYVLGP